jgi:hypothetical protein
MIINKHFKIDSSHTIPFSAYFLDPPGSPDERIGPCRVGSGRGGCHCQAMMDIFTGVPVPGDLPLPFLSFSTWFLVVLFCRHYYYIAGHEPNGVIAMVVDNSQQPFIS